MSLESVRKAALSVALLAFLAGCSGYRVAELPTAEVDPAEAETDGPVVSAGMPARVHLKSGEVIEGDVVRVDSESITIGRAGNFGLEETTFAAAEIIKVEVASSTKASSYVTGTIGGVMIVAVFVVVLAVLFGDFGPMD